MFARMDRLGESGALLMIDIDHFKQINDVHGHSAGDDVLRAVARTMASDLRLLDHIFRVGGEEFAAILTGATATSVQITAERLRQALASVTVVVGGVEIAVTVSIGAAIVAAGAAPSALVAAADKALYRAKKEGRNRVAIDAAVDATGLPSAALL
jgi:diguanylate cyclase (GGDEF)-like protein